MLSSYQNRIQAKLKDHIGLVPDHCNKDCNYESHTNLLVFQHIKILFTLYCGLLSVQ